jgi:hypothetical protein
MFIQSIEPTAADIAKAWAHVTPLAREYERTKYYSVTHEDKMAIDLIGVHVLKNGKLHYNCPDCIKDKINLIIKHLNAQVQQPTKTVNQIGTDEVLKLPYNDLVKYARAMGVILKPGIKKPELQQMVLNL